MIRAFATLAAMTAAAPVPAETPPPSSPDVVVTARLPAPLEQVTGAKVIDRGEIEARNAIFAADVLGTVPGVALSRTGAFGGVTGVRIRGASVDKTLVLIDGVPVNDPSQPAGGFDFGSLDLADVERIEVLSGPQGSLWGSEAIGGVVNILTREPAGWRASAEAGSYATRRFTGAAGVTSERYALGLSTSLLRSDGISKADVDDGASEADAFKNATVSANARLSPADWLKLEARVRYNKADVEFDSFSFTSRSGVADGPDVSHVTNWSGLTRATVQAPGGVVHTLSVDASSIDRVYGGAFPFQARGGRRDYRWLAERAGLGPHGFAVGVERQETHENTGDGRQTAAIDSAFAIWRFQPDGPVATTVSVRRDEPDRFAGRTSARGEIRLRLGRAWTAAASVGQGFKVPSLFQTGYPCFECAVPGPARGLRPERAEGYDLTLGWAQARGRAEASVTLYRLGVRDQIDYAFPFGYRNLQRTRSDGLESAGRVRLAPGLWLRGEYALTDARDLATGARLLRVPRHAGSLGLDWTRHRVQGAVLVRAQSAAADVYGTIKPFTVTELSGAYALTPRLKLTLRVENLFDVHYQQAFGYGEPGLSAYAGVALRY